MVTIVQVLPFIQREQTAAVTQTVVSSGMEKSHTYTQLPHNNATVCGKGKNSLNLATESASRMANESLRNKYEFCDHDYKNPHLLYLYNY